MAWSMRINARYGGPMDEPTAEETSKRLRAMWGYSGDEQGDFIAKLPGANKGMLRRKGAIKTPPEVLRAAASAVGWSTAFADDGPAAIAPADESTAARVNTLAQAIISLASGDATTALRAARSAVARRPPGTAQDGGAPGHLTERPGDDGR